MEHVPRAYQNMQQALDDMDRTIMGEGVRGGDLMLTTTLPVRRSTSGRVIGRSEAGFALKDLMHALG